MHPARSKCSALRATAPAGLVAPAPDARNVTLHRNRFSCSVPERLGNVSVIGLVIMGNMLGLGRELNSSWILPEEQQSFLYYSYEV